MAHKNSLQQTQRQRQTKQGEHHEHHDHPALRNVAAGAGIFASVIATLAGIAVVAA